MKETPVAVVTGGSRGIGKAVAASSRAGDIGWCLWRAAGKPGSGRAELAAQRFLARGASAGH